MGTGRPGEATQDPLSLDGQLCFAAHAAALAIKKAYRLILDELGLTYTQYLVLMVLWVGDDLRVLDIGRRLDLDSGTLTPVLKRLEVLGLVKRARRLQDEREVAIFLTAQGGRLRDRALGARQQIVDRLKMTDLQIMKLRSSLHDLVETIGDRGRSHDSGKTCADGR